MSTVGRPNIHFQDKRNELIRIAFDLFMSKGYEATTIADVLRAAGISKGSLYHYFASKEEILDAVIEYLGNLVRESYLPVLENPEISAMEKLKYLFSPHREQGQMISRTENHVLNRKKSLFHYCLREKNEALIKEAFERIILQGVSEGVFHTEHPVTMAHLLASAEAAQSEETLATRKEIGVYTQMMERCLGAPAGYMDEIGDYIAQKHQHYLRQYHQ